MPEPESESEPRGPTDFANVSIFIWQRDELAARAKVVGISMGHYVRMALAEYLASAQRLTAVEARQADLEARMAALDSRIA